MARRNQEVVEKPSVTNRPDKPVRRRTSTKATTAPETKPIKQRESLPAPTPEGREKQLVNLAVELAEKQLRDGTASSAVITHYLKMASKREVLEREILEKQSKLIEAKAKNIDKERESEELTKAAIEAMKNYNSGS